MKQLRIRILLFLIPLMTAQINSTSYIESKIDSFFRDKNNLIISPVVGLIAGAGCIFDMHNGKLTNHAIKEATVFAVLAAFTSWIVFRAFTAESYYRSAQELLEENNGIYAEVEFLSFKELEIALGGGNSKEKTFVNSTEYVAYAAAHLVEILNNFNQAIKYLERADKNVQSNDPFKAKIQELLAKINRAYTVTRHNLILCEKDSRFLEHMARYATKENAKILGEKIAAAINSSRVQIGLGATWKTTND